ncbi:hypothetical protein [Dehalobacter restrictus]|uniref:Uncharacterized protein n=1 Tax=Dehalobacter restrictus TaxID=55583 RepID=A0A857DFG4_9FIRM|nr:hypothetical protein [Dehalobacter restrictus]QGZ99440.1 hypothetical protein GQ588_01540 [Dehalobacter restrictus]
MAYYANQIDYDLAKSSNPNADVRLYTPGATLSTGDYYLGNANGINLNGAQALTGADRNATNTLFNQASSAKTVQSTPDIQSKIDALKQAQIAQNVAALSAKRDTSLSNLATEKAAIEPQYYKDRNTAATTNAIQAKNFAEYMAQRNGGNADQGVSNQATIADNVALQGGLNSLNTQEQAAYDTNARDVTNVNNSYASDLASAQANAEATALQNTIDQMNADRTYALNKASTDASVASTNADTEYTRLQIAGYPSEQAAKMAQAAATLTGTNLSNDYQKLVNAGYPAQQAAELAQKAASAASSYANISQGNQQLAISQQNANNNALNDITSNLNNAYVTKDATTGSVAINPALQSAIISMYSSGQLSKANANKLLTMYGFSQLS